MLKLLRIVLHAHLKQTLSIHLKFTSKTLQINTLGMTFKHVTQHLVTASQSELTRRSFVPVRYSVEGNFVVALEAPLYSR